MGGWKNGWFEVPYQVIFRDVDAIGHVNNAVYFTYFEIGRTECWFDLTGGSQPFDLGFIVAHANCDFRHQLRMERITIRVRIGEMRNTSLDFLHEIRNAGGELVANGTVVMVLFDWKTNSKRPITDEFRRLVASRQGEEV